MAVRVLKPHKRTKQKVRVLQPHQRSSSSSSRDSGSSRTGKNDNPFLGMNANDLLQYAQSSLKKAKASLGGVRPPTRADELNPMEEIQTPDNRPEFPDISSVSGRSEFYKSYIESQERIADEARADAEAQRRSPEAQASQSFLQKLLSSPSPSEAREDAMEETGINPKSYFASQKARIREIDKLSDQLTKVIEAKDQQLAASADRMASNDFINNQQAQIERNAAPKINALSANIKSKAAVMEMEQGNFQEAQNFVNQAVQDATADLNFTRTMWATFYELNESKLEKLDIKYQNAVKSAWDTAEKAYEVGYAEKQQIGQMMLEYPGSGISITDTLDQAYAKASVVAGQMYSQSLSSRSSGSSGGGRSSTSNRFTKTQLNKGASSAGLSLGDFMGLDEEVQNFYISMNKTQRDVINSYIEDVSTGALSYDEAVDEILSVGFPPSVEEYLISQLQRVETEQGGGGLWGGINNAVNFAGAGINSALNTLASPANYAWKQFKSLLR